MKNVLPRLLHIVCFAAIGLVSCQKYSTLVDPDPPDEAPSAKEPPFSLAGPDHVITLPEDSVVLDATASSDPDGIITDYRWSRFSGPSSFLITDSMSARTVVKNLTSGQYQFELAVTDNDGLISKDMVDVTVFPSINTDCNGHLRPIIQATLGEIGTLSESRMPYVGAAANKIVFAGGPHVEGPWYNNSSAVDIYDLGAKAWTTAALNKASEGMGTTSCGSKIFFAGGGFWDLAFEDVNIYDASTDAWSKRSLSLPRAYLAAATIGNKVFFAGGFTDGWEASSRVDIYDLSTDTWTTAELSEPRYNLSAVSQGDKIYFAGGYRGEQFSKQVDIYDNSTNTWSTSSLKELSGFVSGVALGNRIYWAGTDPFQNIGKIEIWNTTDGSITSYCLTYARQAPIAVTRNNDVAFFASADWNTEVDQTRHSTNQFDIYNTLTGQWSVGILPEAVVAPAVISIKNVIYMGGGKTGPGCTDKVYVVNW